MKADILAVAVVMFRKYGYEGTTLQKIADVLNITKGAINYHFKNKHLIMDPFILSYFELIRNFIDTYQEEYQNAYCRFAIMYIYIYRNVLKNKRNEDMFFNVKQMNLWQTTKINYVYNIYKTIAQDFHKNFTHEELMMNVYMDLGARRRVYWEYKNNNILLTIDKFCYYVTYLIGCLSSLDEATIKKNLKMAFHFADTHTAPVFPLFA